MNIIKIFIASSYELKDDRAQLDMLISRKNKTWINRNIFLESVMWEDFIDAVSKTRLQDEYNKAIKESDIFIMLFYSKIGKYTEEEFETAFGHFKENQKPFIYIYFKSDKLRSAEENSLEKFKHKLRTLGHFETLYKSSEDLCSHFYGQLEKLYEKEFKLRESKGLSENLFNDALEFLRMEDYQASIDLLQKLLSSAPLNSDYHYYLALVMLQGRHPKSLRLTEADVINKHLEKACKSGTPKAHYFYLWAFVKANFYLANGFRIPEPSIQDILSVAEQYYVDNDSLNVMLKNIPYNNNVLDFLFNEKFNMK